MSSVKNWYLGVFGSLAAVTILVVLIISQDHPAVSQAQEPLISQDALLSAPVSFRSAEIQRFLEQQKSPLAGYREPVGDTSLPAADLVWFASQGENYGLNPKALLTTLYLEQDSLDWPQYGGLLAHLQEIGGQLAALEAEGTVQGNVPPGQAPTAQPKSLPAGSSAVYALERYYASGAKAANPQRATVQGWATAYQKLFGESAQAKAVEPPATTVPFLRLPFDQPAGNFYRIESFFDHEAPGYFQKGNIYRFDGKYLSNAQFKTCWDGLTCYAGHNGLDYAVPTGTPLYAAAAGKVILRYDYEGGLILDHGNGYRTVYWHMDRIIVNLNQQVADGQLLGWSDNRGQSTGPHLHFVLRLSALSRDVDPYGWWAPQKDPWPFTSRFMFRGGLLVDNRDAACQLFYFNYWTRDPRGYGGESWYSRSNVSYGISTNWGIWGTYIPRAGAYTVYAFWPKTPENTTSAGYQVWHAKGLSTITVSQRDDGDRWVLLGTFSFNQGQAAVILTDLTHDNPTRQRVYFDAIKWEPVDKIRYYFPQILANGGPIVQP